MWVLGAVGGVLRDIGLLGDESSPGCVPPVGSKVWMSLRSAAGGMPPLRPVGGGGGGGVRG